MRIPFDSLTLAAVVSEAQSVVGGRLQRIVMPDAMTLVLSIYKTSERHFLISCHPEFARAHFQAVREPTPRERPTFCSALRKQISDSRLVFVRQRGLDRILELGFTGAEGDYQLVAELMGKHSNMMLIDSDRRLAAAAKWVGRRQSRRPILPNQLYEPPPFEPKPSILSAKSDDRLADFEGVSPFLAKVIESGTSLEKVQTAIKTCVFQPVLSPGHGVYPLPIGALGLPEEPASSLSEALEAHFSVLSRTTTVDQARRQLQVQLERTLDARNVALHGLEHAIETANSAGEIQQTAELILAYQAQIKPGDRELQAWDYAGEPITIPLVPDESPAENAERLFRKARNAKQHVGEVSDQRTRLASDAREIEYFLEKLAQAESTEDVDGIRAVADERRWLMRQTGSVAKEERPYEGHAVRELLSPAGYKVLYGTNATSNDYLTTKVAKPNDWWLHVRGATSAHVILQTQNQPQRVQPADLVFAAQIAVRNSVQKHATYVAVDYTLKKYVRKPRGSAAGFATYTHEKTLHVDP